MTPEVTRRACLLARCGCRDLYLGEIEALRDELSLEAATPELRERARGAHEPTAKCCVGVRTRMLAAREWVEASLADANVQPDASVYVEPDG